MSSFIAGTPSLLFLPARAEHRYAAAHNEDGQGSVPAGVSPVTRSFAGTDDAGAAGRNPALNCEGAEEWRVIPFAPAYEVSSFGRVRRAVTGRALKPRSDRHGYVRTNLQITPGGPASTRLIHQLVCEAFHGPKPSPKHSVAHNDGDRTNNRAENLRWATASENQLDRRKHGTASTEGGRRKLTPQAVVEIRAMAASGCCLRAAAVYAGVALETARSAIVGRTWRHVS